jgi:Cu+-exporting ATPase
VRGAHREEAQPDGRRHGHRQLRDNESAADDELRPLRERLVTAVVPAVPVVAMAMIPALQFEYWQ